MHTNRVTIATLLGQYLTIASKMGGTPSIDISTTINAKRGIQPAVLPQDPKSIGLYYFGIGIRGSSSTIISLGSETIPAMVPHSPSEKNMDLYHPIPVRMALQGTLSTEEAAKYRLKSSYVDSATGSIYDCYWLKRVTYNEAQPVVIELIDDVTDTRTPYTLDPENNLSPSIPTGSETPENIVVGTILNCVLEGWELDEVITHYLQGRRELACVSEFGLYSGAEFEISPTYTEAIAVQLAMHRCIRGHDVSSPNASITESFVLESGNSLITRTFD